MKFSDKLRMLIEERNLTQKQVAIDLNVAASTMGGYVQGSSEPDFDTLIRIAEYFNVSTDYLLNRLSKNTVDQDEEELLRVYRSMEKEYRQIYIEQGKAFLNTGDIVKCHPCFLCCLLFNPFKLIHTECAEDAHNDCYEYHCADGH